MSTTFQFEALLEPVRWTGRYTRIPGKEPAFKATVSGSANVYWSPWNSGEWLTSAFVNDLGVRRMVNAVNLAKQGHGHQAGGSFQINEFGQVICPVGAGPERYWVGGVTGVPSFADPREIGTTFELRLPVSTKAGTPWERPYVGMKFILDANDSIYFQEEDGDVKRKIRLGKIDADLIHRFRQVRGCGQAVRFIVNLHGVVLTKTEPGWQPVFIGYIDPNRWFPKQP